MLERELPDCPICGEGFPMYEHENIAFYACDGNKANLETHAKILLYDKNLCNSDRNALENASIEEPVVSSKK